MSRAEAASVYFCRAISLFCLVHYLALQEINRAEELMPGSVVLR
jgi:hypothetical protein